MVPLRPELHALAGENASVYGVVAHFVSVLLLVFIDLPVAVPAVIDLEGQL